MIRNFITFDQYGHKYPACAWTPLAVPAGALTLPLRHAEVEVISKPSIDAAKGDFWCNSNECFSYEDKSRVLVLRAGDNVRIVVACLEVGPQCDVDAFVEKFRKAKEAAPPETAEQAAAYAQWFTSRLQMSGSMAGAGTRGNAGPGVGRGVAPFVKTMERMPVNLEKCNWQLNGMPGLAIRLKRDGRLFEPNRSAFVKFLNAGDQVIGVNGVMHSGSANHAWMDAATKAAHGGFPPAAPAHTQGSVTFSSTMPYFQPNSLVTVGPLAASSVAALPLESTSPPTLAQGDAATGLGQGDIIVQATLDGRPISTTGMQPADLLKEFTGASAVVLTVLQYSRVDSGAAYHLPWVTSSHGQAHTGI